MRYGMLGMLGAAAVIAYVQRLAISVAAPEIQAELGIDKEQMGGVMAAWSFGYAGLQLPSGWLADRWGSRRALLLYAVLWSLLVGAAAASWNFTSLISLWFLMGAAQAGIFPCAAKAIGQWFPDTERARASGLLGSAMALGIALAPALSAVLLARISWQSMFVLYVFPGLLWALAFYLVSRDPSPRSPAAKEPAFAPSVSPALQDPATINNPYASTVPTAATDHDSGGIGQSHAQPPKLAWSVLLGSWPLRLLCAQQFFRAAGMAFFMNWFPTFLRESRNVASFESGMLAAAAGTGAFLGGLAGGLFSDWLLMRTGRRWLSRQGIAIIGMSCCAILIVSSYFVADSRLAVLCISAGVFFATFGGVSGYTIAIELGGRNVATVFSTMNMCGNIGAGLFPWFVGAIVKHTGSWDPVLFLCAAIFAVDAVCWAMLRVDGPLVPELKKKAGD